MTILETIMRELSSAPEPVLLRVLSFIQSAKDGSTLATNSSNAPRIPGLHLGQVWMSEDFNEPLPDEFWLGNNE